MTFVNLEPEAAKM